MITAIKEKLKKHRKEIVLTCSEYCFCYEVEALLGLLEQKDKEIKGLKEDKESLRDTLDDMRFDEE